MGLVVVYGTTQESTIESPAGPPPRGSALRIAFVIDRLYPGGTELQLLSLISNLDRSRIQPYLILLDGNDELSRSLEPAECPVLRLGVNRLKSVRAILQLHALQHYLLREQISIVQLYSYRDSVAFGVVAGRLARVRHVIRVRNNMGHWMTKGDRLLFHLLNRGISNTITNSNAGRLAAIAQERIVPESIFMLENGLDAEKFSDDFVYSPFRGEGCPTIGVVANLRKVKGIDVFLEAAALVRKSFPGSRFVIAGEGEERDALEDRAAAPDLHNSVQFMGQIEDVSSCLRRLHVAVLSSRAEGLSNSLLEYMACGLPVVATAVGAAQELIQEGVNGRLVPPNDPIALSQAITSTLHNAQAAMSFGSAARASVLSRYCPKQRAEKFSRFLEKLTLATPH